MLDLKRIRKDPQRAVSLLKRKGIAGQIESLLEKDEKWRKIKEEADKLRHQMRALSKEMGRKKSIGEPIHHLLEEQKNLSERVELLEAQEKKLKEEIEWILLTTANFPAEDVPVGPDETGNVVVSTWGEKPSFSFQPRPHWEIGERLGILDMERGAKISGSRFYVLWDLGAKLERALISLMLDVHTQQHGYKEVFPPFLIRRECMMGTGQLPKFEEEMYRTDPDDLFLDPTAEVPVTNLHREEILDASVLPLKYVAYSACFRREAGAAGKDTRGIIRVHQFNKVELVKFTHPETSYQELESLRQDAEEILRKLRLHYRVVLLCTGDLSFASAKTYDLEVWMPGQNRYVEVASISNFEDFQARRMQIRFREEPGKPPRYVHTLNGSGLAIGRTFAAILENYQQEDGSVLIPDALQQYMGCTRITPR
ncbi:MAG: serine--tRNA ligase [bacterium JZ-2024 1]